MTTTTASHFTNLGDLIRRDRDPDKLAIVDLGGEAERRFTYAELDAMARGVARALTARGFARGDRIAILSANRTEFIAAYYGIMRAGLVAVPVNYGSRRDHRFHPARRRRPAGVLRPGAAPQFRPICRPSVSAPTDQKVSTASWIPARSRPLRRGRTSPLCFSTLRARPGSPRASCFRTKAISGWWRPGSMARTSRVTAFWWPHHSTT